MEEVITCLAGERTLFGYFPGRYALMLLADVVADGTPIRELRRGGLAPLLEKPAVRRVLDACGDGVLKREALIVAWPDDARWFLLGLEVWGSRRDRIWHQTSRPGHNLVLQLNFNTGDMARFERLGPEAEAYSHSGHPVCQPSSRRFRATLAWARLDVDFDTDEALIEEIQSDWVRYAAWYGRHHEGLAAFAAPYARLWSEAMLAAAIWFLRRELGINGVFYHDYETGCALKGLHRWRPPRSLYTELPRRFCMQRTADAPRFLEAHLRHRNKGARRAREACMFYRVPERALRT